MDKESEIVAKKIESGEYFSEGLEWFHTKFTRPRTEFAYFFIICVTAVVALLIGFASFSELFPLSPGQNFVMSYHIGIDDDAKVKHISIHGMQKPGESPNDAVIRYMITEYVKAREEYIEDRLNYDFGFVTALSGKEVYNEYLNEASTTNPQNPIVLYGKQATKDIIVDDVKLTDNSGKIAHNGAATRAVVNYTSVLTYLSDSSQVYTRYQADIAFQYKQIDVDQKTGKVSKFETPTITSYTTKPIQTPQK